MGFILSTTLSYILLYKYAALFLATYLSALFIPFPSDTLLLATGAFASQGYLNIYFVLFASLSSNILGDLTGFFIARRYGREVLVKIGLRKMLNSPKFIGLEKFIADHSRSTIFVTRFVGQLGPITNILSGLSTMSFKRYFLYESLGELADVLIIGLAGYLLGNTWQNITATVELVGVGLVIVIVAFVLRQMYFRKLQH